jgi:hypothetical protein
VLAAQKYHLSNAKKVQSPAGQYTLYEYKKTKAAFVF